MQARVSTYAGTPDQAQVGIRNFEGQTGALRSLDGFEGAYLLLDRETGRALTMTLWSSEDAAQASAEQARQMRSEAAGGAGMTVERVETYEVVALIQPAG